MSNSDLSTSEVTLILRLWLWAMRLVAIVFIYSDYLVLAAITWGLLREQLEFAYILIVVAIVLVVWYLLCRVSLKGIYVFRILGALFSVWFIVFLLFRWDERSLVGNEWDLVFTIGLIIAVLYFRIFRGHEHLLKKDESEDIIIRK